jgi:hypothetical protein
MVEKVMYPSKSPNGKKRGMENFVFSPSEKKEDNNNNENMGKNANKMRYVSHIQSNSEDNSFEVIQMGNKVLYL